MKFWVTRKVDVQVSSDKAKFQKYSKKNLNMKGTTCFLYPHNHLSLQDSRAYSTLSKSSHTPNSQILKDTCAKKKVILQLRSLVI